MANQIENNNLSVQKENIDLSALVEDTVKRYFTEHLETKNITMQIEKDIHYSGDKELLPSIIINLIENAVKYSFDMVHIEVVLKMYHHKPLLEIKDNGSGIPDTEKETIFHKFYRTGNEHTRKTKGTGIGLYIVKSICDLHGIHVKALDHSPKGSVFQLQF